MPIPHCHNIWPVRAVQDWLAAAEITEGPVFREVRGARVSDKPRSGHPVAKIFKKLVIRANLDHVLFSDRSQHAGFGCITVLDAVGN
jgi:hypothetical protein